ncbi:unnamed protein product [Phytomonas sp. Hart1]|nr:unnamed protein product [Phytomonas sp. Hart1]|eukprot:CCW71479.1 unnamed protein product [Phytomonas sp. isolate Hart1]
MTIVGTGNANHDLPEAFVHLKETFSFLDHEREDVQKMAVQGIASLSKDDKTLWAFMSSPEYGPHAIDTLLKHFHPGSVRLVGNILTILINSAADGACAEMLVARKIVRKSMLFLDGMENSSHPKPFKRSVQEMILMLLNNLTASHISAVDDLLQKGDEAMRGFYLGRLHVYYMSTSSGALEGAKDAALEENAKADEAAPPRRDFARWILSILLNLTRSLDGQQLLLEDEEWRGALCECLEASHPLTHRRLASECYRNCACSQKPQYAMLLQSGSLRAAVGHLASGKECDSAVQMCYAELIASMLESVEGVEQLEGMNAKKALGAAVLASRASRDAGAVVENEGSSASEPHVKGCFAPDVCEFLEKHVLLYMDDIVDAYLPPNCGDMD